MTYLQLLDRDYLRIPTKNKVPLRKDWSLPIHHYYKEPLTIAQLLKTYHEYGIRLGLFVLKDYHLAVLYFRPFSEYWVNLFPKTSYTLTENGLYYWLLIKELPPTCLLKNKQGESLGNFYGNGKLVIGSGSTVNNFTYQWTPRKQDYLTFNSLKEFKKTLTKLKIKLAIKGKVKLNKTQNEWIIPTKLKSRWKKRNLIKAKLKPPKLVKCLDCNRQLKPSNLIQHLLKIHAKTRARKRKKLWRTCRRCQATYRTLIKKREHKEFYCFKNKPLKKISSWKN